MNPHLARDLLWVEGSSGHLQVNGSVGSTSNDPNEKDNIYLFNSSSSP